MQMRAKRTLEFTWRLGTGGAVPGNRRLGTLGYDGEHAYLFAKICFDFSFYTSAVISMDNDLQGGVYENLLIPHPPSKSTVPSELRQALSKCYRRVIRDLSTRCLAFTFLCLGKWQCDGITCGRRLYLYNGMECRTANTMCRYFRSWWRMSDILPCCPLVESQK